MTQNATLQTDRPGLPGATATPRFGKTVSEERIEELKAHFEKQGLKYDEQPACCKRHTKGKGCCADLDFPDPNRMGPPPPDSKDKKGNPALQSGPACEGDRCDIQGNAPAPSSRASSSTGSSRPAQGPGDTQKPPRQKPSNSASTPGWLSSVGQFFRWFWTFLQQDFLSMFTHKKTRESQTE